MQKNKFFYNYKVFKNGVLIQHGRKFLERDWLLLNIYIGRVSPSEAMRQVVARWNKTGSSPNIANLTYEYEECEDGEVFYKNTSENENV